MHQAHSVLERMRCSRASRPRRIEHSSSRSTSPGSCGKCSRRSICLRLRSMNARHSGTVIVSKFSEKRSTVDADIKFPCAVHSDGMAVSSSDLIGISVVSQSFFHSLYRSRSPRSVTSLPSICCFRATHSSGVALRNYPLHLENVLSSDFTFELCKGDLSIRFIFSMGCGVLPSATTTFSGQTERF
jgi:hypothetical protein